MKQIYLLLAICFTFYYSDGQEYREWTGSGDWTNSSNWSGGGGDYTYAQLEFKGGGGTTSNNDDAPFASQWRLYFSGGTSYTIIGNPVHLFDFGGDASWILSDSSVDQTIENDLLFSDAGTRPAWITTRSTGKLILGTLGATSAVTELRIAGTDTNGSIIINGDITGSKPVIIGRDNLDALQPSTRVEYRASCSYTGATVIDTGVLNLMGDLISSDVTVNSGAVLVIDGTLTIKSLTVNTGGDVIITPGNALTVTGAIVNDGNLVLESVSTSYSSLIPEGTITGTVNYERHVNGNSTLGDTNAIGDNDLISPPVSGQTFGDFAAANPNLLENPGDATEKAFAIFDKTTGTYENYFTTTNAATVLDARVGYRAATNNTSTLTFSGTVITDSESYNIVNSGPTQADWNLIGNPYPSYILARDFLEHEVDTGVRNIDLFQPDTAAIYGYDGDVNNNTNSYTVYNLATTLPTTVIAPGQGFLVSADPADVVAYDVEFTPAIRTTGTDDDFIIGRGGSLINLELQLTTATDGAVTDFYFNANASLGLDPGYDAAIFGGTAPPFSIYSLLVEDNDGTPFIIQALGDMDFGDTTVALGVNANQGEQLTFSVSTNTLPGTVEVYLDDTVASTSTLLSSGDYVLTPATELIGTGRFYLRFSDSSLSTFENSFDDLTIYTNQAQRSIVISGQLVEHTIANIYDIQGRLVRSQQLDTTTTLQTITASELGTGVYIVELSNDRTSKTEKIILN